MKILSSLGVRIRGLANRTLAAVTSGVGRFFYRRPALKRALLAFILQQVVLVPFALLGGHTSLGFVHLAASFFCVGWTAFLFGVFWGMGAERASVEWDSVFALPTVASFRVWRWHALERKRFFAVIMALSTGLVIAGVLGGA